MAENAFGGIVDIGENGISTIRMSNSPQFPGDLKEIQQKEKTNGTRTNEQFLSDQRTPSAQKQVTSSRESNGNPKTMIISPRKNNIIDMNKSGKEDNDRELR